MKNCFKIRLKKAKQHHEKFNATTTKKQTCADLAKNLHATCISLPMPTLTKAINNNQFAT